MNSSALLKPISTQPNPNGWYVILQAFAETRQPYSLMTTFFSPLTLDKAGKRGKKAMLAVLLDHTVYYPLHAIAEITTVEMLEDRLCFC